MDLFTLGIDVGSTTSKCVILKNGAELMAKALVPFGTGTSGPRRVRREVLDGAGLTEADIAYTLATGYGRQAEGIADSDMSELSCHAMGARLIHPGTRTVIDIGGQDIKVLQVEEGALVSFQMNDKCAAGTGRFLEVMAKVLEVELGELADLSARSVSPVQISSTCTVFAESEVISQLSKGAEICDIVAGIHRSVTSKVIGLAQRVGLREDVLLTGGVSRNSGVIRELEAGLKCRVWASELSQYAGAMGAAAFGFEKVKRGRGA